MLDSGDVLLLIGVAIILAATFAITKRRLAYHSATAQKYKLFAVRDNLIFLVAAKKIEPEDWLFSIVYSSVTRLLHDIKLINLRDFVSTIARARSEGQDPAEHELAERIGREVHNRPPEVQEVVVEFYQAVIAILLANSLLLRLSVRAAPLVRLITRIRRWFDSGDGGSTPLQAYRLRRDYDNAAALVAR